MENRDTYTPIKIPQNLDSFGVNIMQENSIAAGNQVPPIEYTRRINIGSSAQCSIWKNFSSLVENVELHSIVKNIASDKYKAEVEKIRWLFQQERNEEATENKNKLLAFTPSGTFKGKRLRPSIELYSGLIHLDFDKIDMERLEEAFKIISRNKYTLLCFRSPSGKGLKVFVEVDKGAEHHANAYIQVKEHYEKALGLKADRACKDITRLCYMSWDPNLYQAISHEIFEVIIPFAGSTGQGPSAPFQQLVYENDYTPQLEYCTRLTERIRTYSEGQRNDFIHVLACNCNRKGIPEQIALKFALSRYDLPSSEVNSTFHGVYERQIGEFAKLANSANFATTEGEPVEDILKSSPTIPDDLYGLMPEIIRQGASVFSEARERDVFLTGALAILSGCLPGVKGLYDGQVVYPNLYSFVIAPAASGKGAMKFAKMLGDEYHLSVVQRSKEAVLRYKTELSQYNLREKGKENSDTFENSKPEKPTFKVVFIPANTSYAMVLSHLEQNDGFGIICETEADTMGIVFKQDWGGYSDMLRKAFHHERISSSRKTNNEFIEVQEPRVSTALTGTPGQVVGIIASSEDGLMSRFLYYVFKAEQKWKDVSPAANRINLTEHFKSLSNQVYEMVQFLKTEETIIDLSPAQWQEHKLSCEKWLTDVTMFTAEEAASIVKRLGLIIYRMAMLFTALRKHSNAVIQPHLECDDIDFRIALSLGKIYLQHSVLMFNNLPKQIESNHFLDGSGKRKFFDALSTEFTRKNAVECGQSFNLSTRTVDEILRNATGKMLEKHKAGLYRKM